MDIGANRGLSNSVQVVVLLPMLIGLFLLLLQWSLHAGGDATARAAAQQAAVTAAAYDGDAGRGQTAGEQVANNGALRDVRVEVRRGATETTATVSGAVVVVVWPARIQATVAVPTERITG